MSVVLGCVQPAFLAWVPFFQRMAASDVFVYLDDVEFSRNSPHNRNRILSAHGPQLMTVPVRYRGHSHAFICNIEIAQLRDWQRKHLRSIEMNYHRAPYFRDLDNPLRKIYGAPWLRLGDLNVALLDLFRDYLGIRTPCFRSSQMHVEGSGNEKLVNLCRRVGAMRFLVKPGTEHYHPPDYFAERGIELNPFHYSFDPYPQSLPGFVPALSVLDYAMNCGPSSLGKSGDGTEGMTRASGRLES